MKLTIPILLCAIAVLTGSVPAGAADKPRYFVLTDATTSTWQKKKVSPEIIQHVIDGPLAAV